ncbi:hypothetical protein PDIG_50170 [Penicillium digitatum PHI26]|uniref:Uncharacterized protein n=2 Tax=Penicillium digitatum TaxID=36651 RepID=K9FQN6_PEND2|nr:hypothetical protein PDIP_19410 [Penicillium digitatum Pd1]EKV11484.1 hypothetical protein PDIG_50170 [Penicillium digitatum PHI26]EKV20162.1 hypothetical protein PDIP_19410 [Penicillium digitatum Pd1]
MLDVDVQHPILDKVTGCHSNPDAPSIGWNCGAPVIAACHKTSCRSCTDARATQWEVGIRQGNLWTIASTRLSYSPDGCNKRALSTPNGVVSKQRKMGNVVGDGRWMEVDENKR